MHVDGALTNFVVVVDRAAAAAATLVFAVASDCRAAASDAAAVARYACCVCVFFIYTQGSRFLHGYRSSCMWAEPSNLTHL